MDSGDLSRELRVLATFHRPYAYNADSRWLRPCTVGKFRLQAPGVHCDADGEGISELNPWFCELTALYWAWKNLPDVAHIGLCHYRRYFYLGATPLPGTRVPVADRDGAILLMSGEQAGERALDLLRWADAIVPAPFYLSIPIGQHYTREHDAEPWRIFIELLLEQQPQNRPRIGFLEQGNRYTFCNMLIARRELFDRYCGELFPLMFELHRRVPPPSDPYQARYIGFIAERFLMFFLFANGVRTFETPLVGLEPGA
jgi:hypothetical protein